MSRPAAPSAAAAPLAAAPLVALAAALAPFALAGCGGVEDGVVETNDEEIVPEEYQDESANRGEDGPGM